MYNAWVHMVSKATYCEDSCRRASTRKILVSRGILEPVLQRDMCFCWRCSANSPSGVAGSLFGHVVLRTARWSEAPRGPNAEDSSLISVQQRALFRFHVYLEEDRDHQWMRACS